MRRVEWSTLPHGACLGSRVSPVLPEARHRDTLCGLMKTQELELESIDLGALAEDEGDDAASGVYELGFHLLSTLSEGEVLSAVEALKGILKDAGASLFAERAPLMMPLAYGIDAVIDGARRTFDSAYFGWLAFEASPSALAMLNEKVAVEASVLRHLVVKTNRDAVSATLADPALDAAPLRTEPVEASEAAPEDATLEAALPDPEVA